MQERFAVDVDRQLISGIKGMDNIILKRTADTDLGKNVRVFYDGFIGETKQKG